MSHLSDGTLRRIQDEPAATSAADSAHLAACPACRGRGEAIRAEAAGVSSLLAVPEAEVAPELALVGLRDRAAAHPPGNRRGLGWLEGIRRRRAFRPVTAAIGAVALMGVLVATGVAEGVVQQFEPKQFVAVNVNPGSLDAMPDLSQFGTYKITKQPKFTAAETAEAAAAGSGLKAVLAPSGPLPRTVTGKPQYQAFTQMQGSFTFQADKAREYAKSKGKVLPPMPKGVDGTTLSVTAGPGVLMLYGAPDLAPAAADGKPAEPGMASKASPFHIPSLAIAQTITPKAVSDGASVQVLEEYLASLPGVPKELAAQIRAIGDPTSTLPIPVPTGQGSHQVDINGSKGLFVGDSTGLGAGVIWQKDGVLYAVVGTLSESDVVAVARSLR
jgi:anti-sigma factor RsiW